MTPNEYVQLVQTTESNDYTQIRMRLTTSIPIVRLQHAIAGMVTEVGELQDILKKYYYYDKNINPVHLREEIGDLLWYVGLAIGSQGWSMEDIMKENINKLRARYPNKFTEWEAKNRD